MSDELPTIEPSQPCCDVWLKIVGRFGWFQYQHQRDMMTMPHLDGGGNHWRVNFCPSCGKDVRSYNLPLEALKQALQAEV